MFVYLDIETGPSEDRPPESWARMVKVGNRGAEKADEYRKEKADEAWRQTSLDTVFARVLCIGVAVGDTAPVCILEDTEEATLRTFASRLRALDDRLHDQREPLVWVAHNGLRFDVPLLGRRLAKYAKNEQDPLNLACSMLWCTKRYGSYHHVDTMNDWIGSGDQRGTHASLNVLCEHFGINRDDNPCEGSQIFDHWQAAEMDVIRNHVLADVRALREVHRRMQAAGMSRTT